MLTKTATAQADAAARSVAINNQLKREALGQLGTIMLAGLGGGAAIRGVTGIGGLFNKKKQIPEPDTYSNTPSIIEVPVPRLHTPTPEEEEEERKKRQLMGMPKLAGGIYQKERSRTIPPVGSNARRDYDTWKPENRGMVGFAAGDNATDAWSIPWMAPSAVLGGGAALYGGYKLTDWLLNKRRKTDTENELDDAKKKYRNALYAQYTPSQLEKTSNDIGAGLAALSDKYIKEAHLSNLAGKALGGYGVLAGTLALGTGLATYNYMKSRSPEERIKKILRQRAQERFLRRPPELYAVPQDVPIMMPRAPSDEDDNENEEDLKRKAAGLIRFLR